MSNAGEVTYRKVLVPLDGSGFAEVALPHAVDICHRMNASLVLLQVIPPISSLLSMDETTVIDLEALKNQARAEAEAYIRARTGEMREMNISTKGLVIEGVPIATQILNVAAAEEVDLIVMSTHGRGGLSRWMYGSVARKVLLGANVPVLMIPARKS